MTYHGFITHLQPNEVFVFGSNPSGNHGAGTARIALEKYGAVKGIGRGLMPTQRSYGLVTKNLIGGYYEPSTGITYHRSGFRSVSYRQIVNNIKDLYAVAETLSHKRFLIAYTADGRNLNGYTSNEMAQMFVDAGPIPQNIVFEDAFYQLMIYSS